MRILTACECSGALRDQFSKLGHHAVSCDLKPSSAPGRHYQCDVFDLKNEKWDLVFAFPPCTYLAKVQMFRYRKSSYYREKRNEAVSFVDKLWNSFPVIAIENPSGYLNNNWRSPAQIIYPWQFGDPYSKEICLWLKNCPPVISTRYSIIRKSISNHVNSRMSQARKSEIKSSWLRYPGMCKAIAEQYSNVLSV